MLKFIAILLSSLSLCVAADSSSIVKPEAVGLSSARLERLAQAIKQDVDHGRMPGAVVAIARKGKQPGKRAAVRATVAQIARTHHAVVVGGHLQRRELRFARKRLRGNLIH